MAAAGCSLGWAGVGEGAISHESAGQLKLGVVAQPEVARPTVALVRVETRVGFSTESLAFLLRTGGHSELEQGSGLSCDLCSGLLGQHLPGL